MELKCDVCKKPPEKGAIIGRNTGKPYCFDCSGKILIKNTELRGDPEADKKLQEFIDSLKP